MFSLGWRSPASVNLGSQEVTKYLQQNTDVFFENMLTATNKVANPIQDISSTSSSK
ncbi:hypothetical protein [Paenibacillus taichungensis]|uniref:hypothetical protein n=1 Tax=Paenibacillus taichungensis TaxID=484184 RepID=UPI0039A16DC0